MFRTVPLSIIRSFSLYTQQWYISYRFTNSLRAVSKWSTFTYYSPAIRKITNLFKNSTIGIAFRSSNTIFKQITKKIYEQINPSGIYEIKCNTCNKVYVGQTGRGINTRYKEHIRYIKTNNPQSAMPHIFCTTDTNMAQLMKHCSS